MKLQSLLDIEELQGLEFHQLMQDRQTVEALGVKLQRLGRKAFSTSGQKELDLMLKGRFYQALLPKWQQRLGAPKTTESFNELFARARTLERHDQQFNSARGDAKSNGKGVQPPTKTDHTKAESTRKSEGLSQKDRFKQGATKRIHV